MDLAKPPNTASNRAALRLILGAFGIALLLFAAWVSANEFVVIHGKRWRFESVYQGADAQAWAIFFACFGAAMFAPWFRRSWAIGLWLGLWMTVGVAVPVGIAYWSARHSGA